MTIETKFNVGDKVYVLCNRQVCWGDVIRIVIDTGNRRVVNCGLSVCYTIDLGWTKDEVDERCVFATKEDLINSL